MNRAETRICFLSRNRCRRGSWSAGQLPPPDDGVARYTSLNIMGPQMQCLSLPKKLQ